MNNADLAEKVAEANGLTKADARKVIDGVFAAIADAAASGDEIAINGFGKFKVKHSPAREGRNPSTGAAMKIAASRKLGFTVAILETGILQPEAIRLYEAAGYERIPNYPPYENVAESVSYQKKLSEA